MTETLIDLIRHGEPEGGRAYRGHSIDDPLSEKGWRQMWDAVGDQHPWDQIISSPMQRCRAFADALGERHGIPVAGDVRLREVGFGSWEGRTPDQIQADDPEEYAGFYADPVNCRPAGAEPITDFTGRVSEAYDDVLTSYTGKHCLLVAHAGVLRAVIARTLQAAPIGMYRIKVDNAGITRIRHAGVAGKLEFLNGRLGG